VYGPALFSCMKDSYSFHYDGKSSAPVISGTIVLS
jgi:hypothetical protein